MNYFAHGIRFLDRPYFLAGTALPDWLSIADRRVRLRARNVLPFSAGTGLPRPNWRRSPCSNLRRHAWFHKSAAFAVTSAELTVLLRQRCPPTTGTVPRSSAHPHRDPARCPAHRRPSPADWPRYYSTLSAARCPFCRRDGQSNEQVLRPTGSRSWSHSLSRNDFSRTTATQVVCFIG